MTEETKLLPCPFCGQPAKLEEDSDHHGEFFSLGCSSGYDSGCPGHHVFYTELAAEKEKCISSWNKRDVSEALRSGWKLVYTKKWRTLISAPESIADEIRDTLAALSPPEPTEGLREGLDAAIRATKLALFVINKQGVMPNSSWESGFKSDLDKAVAARDAARAMPKDGTTNG